VHGDVVVGRPLVGAPGQRHRSPALTGLRSLAHPLDDLQGHPRDDRRPPGLLAPGLVRAVARMIMKDADPEVIRGMLANAPLVPRLMLPFVGAYARYARRIHGAAAA
jgi:hypothetical protein